MPTIFDNMSDDRLFLKRIERKLKDSSHADICVGYFSLHGYSDIADEIQHYQGGEDHQLRVIVGMSNTPHADARSALRTPEPQDPANEDILKRKKKALEQFADQFSFRTPNPSDESALLRLRDDLKAGRIVIKLFTKHQLHAKLYLTYSNNPSDDYPTIGFIGSSNLTYGGLRGQGELNIDIPDQTNAAALKTWFDDHWHLRSTVDISADLIKLIDEGWVRKATPYEIYLKMVYHMSQDVIGGRNYRIPADIRKDLLEFQVAAVQLAARHVDTRGGALLGDVVGLGKSMMATAIVRIFEEIYGWRTLIICPKNLVPMWQDDYINKYDLHADVMSVSQANTLSSLTRRYKLIIVDESHNLRNPEAKAFQYVRDYIAEQSAKVILLSATPYNISAADIATQLRLFLDPDTALPVRPEVWLRETPAVYRAKILTNTRPDTLKAFENSPYPEDWRDLLRLFMVRRTRSFIKKHYAKFDEHKQQHYLTFGNGKQSYFPQRLPKTAKFVVNHGDQYATLYSEQVVEIIGNLQLPRYGLKSYLDPRVDLQPDEKRIVDDLSRAGFRLKGFARSSFFKRLESSGKVFLQSLQRHIMRNAMLIHAIESQQPIPVGQFDAAEFDEVINDQDFLYGGIDEDASVMLAESAERLYNIVRTANVRWLRAEVFDASLKKALLEDNQSLTSIINMIGAWNPATDEKLNALERLLTKTHAKDKILVFTQFADTAQYLVTQLKQRGVPAIAEVTGQSENPAKIADRFSPKARKKQGITDELRIIVATDVLSEGQNLQDAHIVVNFDLPWAVIRLVQRAGRVDRIGQESPEIWCYSFLPTDGVESILNLRRRIVDRLRQQGEILGGDEQFIEDVADEQTVMDVFTEKTSIYEDKDNEVDMASYCYQIWSSAIQANRELEKSIPRLPAQLRSAKAHMADFHEPHGVLTFVKTKSGLSALRYVDEAGRVVSQSAKTVIDLAACSVDTPRAELHPDHDHHVDVVLQQVSDEFRTQEVGIGPANSARYRTYERLKEYCLSLVGDMFRDYDLERVVERMISTPFTERATDTLNRLLRAKDTKVSELADRVMALNRDNMLFVATHADTDDDIAAVVCSLGLVQGNAQ